MEGLIPFLFHAMKKQNKNHRNYRCLSEGSSRSRSYHLLTTGMGSTEGSSHRRTRSEFQPPTSDQLFDQRYGVEYIRSQSVKHDSILSPWKPKESKQAPGESNLSRAGR
ncbi:hypothetical protein BVC80_8915g24 [Macleaya cordata]|uniref:Uncharacterized protein n=1 Tax=Macleaya cordata TaxID=56857 RepID=A0A200QFW4_MACCD|nr:hypothetical protein BVC80_8915g24 [Macleaya cordata]